MSTQNQKTYSNAILVWLQKETTGKCIAGHKLYVNPTGKIKCAKCAKAGQKTIIDCGEHKPTNLPAKIYTMQKNGEIKLSVK